MAIAPLEILVSNSVYRYSFNDPPAMQDVEATIAVALFGTAAIHGESRARMDARYVIDVERRTCVIDSSTDAGQHLNALFTEYCRRTFGEDAFRIERLADGGVGERSAA